MKKINKQIYWTLFGALLLMFAAIYNGFPLVTSDSGMYIFSGFENFVPVDRPPGYGIFIRHSSLASSLWFTIIAQAMIMSYVLWQTINKFIVDGIEKYEKFIIIFLLVVFTGVSWYTSQIMPDIFTPIGILAFLLLTFSEKKKSNTLFNSIIVLSACLVHNSNILIFTILSVLVILYGIFFKVYKTKIISFWKNIFVFILISSSWIISPAINYSINKKFELAGTPHAFLMARYIETGIIDKYLDKNCDKFLIKTLPDTGLYFLSAKHSKKVLDVEGFSVENGAKVHQWTYLGTPNQQFSVVKVKKGWYKIISKNSGKCVEINKDDTSRVQKQVIQNDYKGSDNQLFQFVKTNDSYWFTIINKQTGTALSVENASLDVGAQIKGGEIGIIQGDNQQFRMVAFPHCLCLYKDELLNAAITFLWKDNGVFSKTGSWAFSKEEYSATLNEIFVFF